MSYLSRAARPYWSPAALWLVVRLYQMALGCSGEGTDVALYEEYARRVRSGAAAEEDFRPEYPPAALTLFTVPALFRDEVVYRRGFATLMALFDFGVCLLVFHRARLRPRAPPWGPLSHATLYLVITAALWPVLYARFDIVPAALVLASLHCLDRHRERGSWALLGAAGAVKLWPFALVPLWVAWGVVTPRPGGRAIFARLVSGAVWIAAGALIVSAPVLTMLGDRVASSARYNADRGLQIESTWATAVLVLERQGLVEAEPEEAFGATQIAGRLPSLLANLSLPATVLLVALPIVALLTAGRRRPLRGPAGSSPGSSKDDAGIVLEHAVLAVALGCMLSAKVLSPQFVLWIAPLLALVVEGPTGWLLAFLTAALTSDVYPHRYFALVGLEPGHDRALLALVARNSLLVGWYVMAVRRLAKQRPAVHRLSGGAAALRGPILPLRPSDPRPPAR